MIANGTPVAAALLFKIKNWSSPPLDRNLRLPDGQPLFGPSKTACGIILTIAATALLAPLFKFSFMTGALVGFWAMIGDLLSSFIKRRLGLESSSNAPGLDHIPETLFPLWFLRSRMDIQWLDMAVIILAFILLDLLLSHLLYRLYPRFHSR
jgi:CDP-2,3-bis-(O-geranylgeranyl)-sn-glycerol synthase